MPPMTEAKKITAATRSNPATIFVQGNAAKLTARIELEDRIHPTLSVPARIASRRSIRTTTSSIDHRRSDTPAAIAGLATPVRCEGLKNQPGGDWGVPGSAREVHPECLWGR